MTKVNQDFEMYAGESKNINVTVTDQDGTVDLTGATIRWAVVKSIHASTPTAVISKTVSNGGAAGEFTITLSPADTENLSGVYYHEAELTDAQGNVSTVMTGQMTIQKAVN